MQTSVHPRYEYKYKADDNLYLYIWAGVVCSMRCLSVQCPVESGSCNEMMSRGLRFVHWDVRVYNVPWVRHAVTLEFFRFIPQIRPDDQVTALTDALSHSLIKPTVPSIHVLTADLRIKASVVLPRVFSYRLTKLQPLLMLVWADKT